ncbi:hypothetical protein CspeluHIS016_0115260 [Cutaneotrichosporon spelunceum]|uniref:Uncharacterized protein n=1 Tax=Cutaneotrichosporon spelunceum TaxID=1672016 RepID=A0AAD3TR93_9TREE|nr:hypothetical protein CspeluHIS016_0115260 [Cutaneotrichosporon spelunceum]
MATLAAQRKHSLHFIFDYYPTQAQSRITARRRPGHDCVPRRGAVQDGHAGRPSRLLQLLKTSRALHLALNFDANPVLYNRLLRVTFDLGALVRRTQWMFDVDTDIPGTSHKTELFPNPRSWAMEYRDRWELRNHMRACIAHQSINVLGLSTRENRGTDMWGLGFLWTENGRVGLKSDSTVFQDTGRGVFSLTYIMNSLYHDTDWQRNTVCQNPLTSPGLRPLTFHSRLTGLWRGNLLFYDFDAYRQMLSGNMRSLYTGTFTQHAVVLDLQETVIRLRTDDLRFADEETEEEQALIKSGYGHQVLTGDVIYDREPPGWTKEILLSGGCRSAWGWLRIRGRVRAWDGLVILSIGHSRPYPCGQWVWRGYIQTGGYCVGRWRDCFTPDTQAGYEGSFGLVRAGDLFYPPHFPTTMNVSAGVTRLDFGPNNNVWLGPAPGGVQVRRRSSTPRPYSSQSHSSRSSHGSSSQPRNSHAYAGAGAGSPAAAPRPLANGHAERHSHPHEHPSGRSWASSPASTPSHSVHGSGSRHSSAHSKRKYSEDDCEPREYEYEYRAGDRGDDRCGRRDYD